MFFAAFEKCVLFKSSVLMRLLFKREGAKKVSLVNFNKVEQTLSGFKKDYARNWLDILLWKIFYGVVTTDTKSAFIGNPLNFCFKIEKHKQTKPDNKLKQMLPIDLKQEI